MFSHGPTIREERTGVPTKIFLTLFGLIFAGAGSWHFTFMARGVHAGLQTWAWQKTACSVIASAVGQDDRDAGQKGQFYPDVKYRYTFAGEQFESGQFQRKPPLSRDYGKAARLAAQYPPGASAVCYVNADAPGEAVLERFHLLSTAELLFPLLFVAVGVGVIFSAWRRKSNPKKAPLPVSELAGGTTGFRLLVIFSGAFLCVGLAVTYSFFLRPVLNIFNAKSWPSIPCVVISSEVEAVNGGEDTTYRINILYSYEFGGRKFKSNAYGFMGASSSGREGKRAIVAQYPPGREAVCYVNPIDPTEAVLERGFTSEMWFGLIPVVFVLVGIAGSVGTFRMRRRHSPLSVGATGVDYSSSTQTETGHSIEGKSVVLGSRASPWGRVLGMLFVCLFWNGLTSVFVVNAVRSWGTASPEWGLTIFIIPFVAVGVGMIVMVFYFIMALFNPRPTLTVTPGAVPLGGTLVIQWAFAHRAGVIKSLSLRLEGREEATYARGSSSTTDKSIFADIELVNSTIARKIESGETTVTLPDDLAPTFSAKHNKIIWAIHVRGEIQRWPDVAEEFPVTVRPVERRKP